MKSKTPASQPIEETNVTGDLLSRRAAIGKLAVSTAAVCAAGVAASTIAPGQANASAPTNPQQNHTAPSAEKVPMAPAPWDLLHPLAAGSVLVSGWRVADLTGAVDGSCVITLQNERGRSHRAHICRNDGSPRGLVFTDRFDLVVMNGGQGDLPTEEGFAQSLAEVAHVLAANEDSRQAEPVITALLPHEERLRRFADSSAGRLR
jgi:hypothetical protein